MLSEAGVQLLQLLPIVIADTNGTQQALLVGLCHGICQHLLREGRQGEVHLQEHSQPVTSMHTL